MIEICVGKENNLIITNWDLDKVIILRSESDTLHKLLKKRIIDIGSGSIDHYNVRTIEDINLLFNYYLGSIFNLYLKENDLINKNLDIECLSLMNYIFQFWRILKIHT